MEKKSKKHVYLYKKLKKKSYTNLYFLFMSRRGLLCHTTARLLVMPKARHPHLVIHNVKFIFVADSGGVAHKPQLPYQPI